MVLGIVPGTWQSPYKKLAHDQVLVIFPANSSAYVSLKLESTVFIEYLSDI